MRTLPMPKEGSSEEVDLDNDLNVILLDWKDGPATVLESVDTLLRPYGLEIVQRETNADCFLFRIELAARHEK